MPEKMLLKENIRGRKAEGDYLRGRSGMGSFLERVVRVDGVGGVLDEATFWGVIRETFSRMSVICEWTA